MRFFLNALILFSALSVITPAFGASVTFEAESGALGADFAVSNSSSPAYITITSNGAGSNPGSAARVASYSVTFPAPGTYQLYARVRVGTDTFNDDSLFYASSFGIKTASLNSDWILVNGLGSAGFNNSSDVVTGGGSLGSSVWKWINLSQFTGQTGFTVTAGALTQTFQIGAREDGFGPGQICFWHGRQHLHRGGSGRRRARNFARASLAFTSTRHRLGQSDSIQRQR